MTEQTAPAPRFLRGMTDLGGPLGGGPNFLRGRTSAMTGLTRKNVRHDTQKVRLSYEHMAGHVLSKKTKINPNLNYSPWRMFFADLLEEPIYHFVIGVVILTNAIFVIHETDEKASGDEVPKWLDILSWVFLAAYAVEISIRFWVFRTDFFSSAWNIIDFLVVITDCCGEIAKIWADGNVSFVAVLRIFRLVRLLRVISMLTLFHELQTMLLGFASAMKAMIWASFMIGVVLTVCSIIAVEFIHPLNVEVAKTGVYGDCTRCGRAFETVAESNLTFIQQIIAGDSWGKVTIPIIEAYPMSSIFFLIVFGLIDLGVLNLILTVIVNAAETARETNHEMQLRGKALQTEEMKTHLKQICASIDANEDGLITLEEFLNGVDENEDLRRTLALLDIQRQDAEVIWYLMDEDSSGDVDYNEFVNTMITTKHETLNTKLLFLKASMHQIYNDLRHQQTTLDDEVIKRMMGTKDVSTAVKKALDENSDKLTLQPDKIMAEFENLSRRLDQRWEQLKMEQEKSCQALEKVLGEVSLHTSDPRHANGAFQIRPDERGIARQSKLSSLAAMPPSCSQCNGGQKDMKRECIASGTQSPRCRAGPVEVNGRVSHKN